jgi:hypothetical protein
MSRFRKDRYLTPPDPQREEPLKESTYRVVGTPPPQPVYYEGQLVGWRIPGQEAIFPVSRYRTNPRLFSKT